MKMIRTLLALLCLGGASLFAQNMNPELLWSLGRVSLDDLSPDGKEVLYGITRYDLQANKGLRNLYKTPTSGNDPQLVFDSEASVSAARYIMGGTRIGFLMKGQYYSVKRDGSDLIQHTNIEGGIFAAKLYTVGTQHHLLFGKGVKVLSSPADKYPHLKHAEVKIYDDLMYRHWDSYSDDKVNHLCRTEISLSGPTAQFTDLTPNAPYDLPQNPFGGADDFDMSPDGKFIAYSTKKLTGKAFATSTNTEIYLYNTLTQETQVVSDGLPGYDQHPTFSPNGQYLAWNSMAQDGYESDVNDIVILDLKTNQRYHVLKATGNYDLLTFQNVQWAPDGKSLFAQVPIDGTIQIYAIQIKSLKGAKAQLTVQAITQGNHNFGAMAAAGKTMVVERQDMNHATELFVLNAANQTTTPLTAVNKEVYDRIGLSKIEKRRVKTTDGKEMLVWVIFPPNFDPNKKYPALLYCQGGPQSQVSQFYSYRWNFQLMAAKGYIIVAPNRRGLPGFGKEWNEAISGDWGGQPMLDYLSAIDDVAAEPYVDENRLGAVGASYGGYSVYMLAGIHENRFKALVSHCGLFNMESWYGTTEELFFANWDIGGNYWENPQLPAYNAYNPIKKVDQWTAPLLVIHGGKDFRVPENQGMEAFQAAQLRGIPSKFLYFPNEGHWVLGPQNGLIWHAEFFEWLDQWLK